MHPSPIHKIPIGIADILIELTSPLSARALGIEKRLGPFFGRLKNPRSHVALRWRESEGDLAPQGRLICDPGAVWRMYRENGGDCAALSYHDEGLPQAVLALLQANPSWPLIRMASDPHTPWAQLFRKARVPS